jgi:hypothetical protein
MLLQADMKNMELSCFTVITSVELSHVSGGGALGGPAVLPVRTKVEPFGKPQLWKQEFGVAKEKLGAGQPLSLQDRNIARDYANQSAFHGHGYASPTADNIRAGYGLE